MLIKWQVCNLQVSYCHGNAIIQFHFRIQGPLKHAAWLLAGLQAKIKLKGWHVDFRTWCWHLLANHILQHSCTTADVDLSSFPYLLSALPTEINITLLLLYAAINVIWELRFMNSVITQAWDPFHTLSTELTAPGSWYFWMLLQLPLWSRDS